MRTLFIVLTSSLILFSCREDDNPTPNPGPEALTFYGTLITHQHGNNTQLRDTIFNCKLTFIAHGSDSAMTVTISMPELNSSLSAQFAVTVAFSDDNSKTVTGTDDCIGWQFKRSTDNRSVEYRQTTGCEPGTDYFFEGTR